MWKPGIIRNLSDSACKIRDVRGQRPFSTIRARFAGFMAFPALATSHDCRTSPMRYVSGVKHMANNESPMPLAHHAGNCGPRIDGVADLAKGGIPPAPAVSSQSTWSRKLSTRGPKRAQMPRSLGNIREGEHFVGRTGCPSPASPLLGEMRLVDSRNTLHAAAYSFHLRANNLLADLRRLGMQCLPHNGTLVWPSKSPGCQRYFPQTRGQDEVGTRRPDQPQSHPRRKTGINASSLPRTN